LKILNKNGSIYNFSAKNSNSKNSKNYNKDSYNLVKQINLDNSSILEKMNSIKQSINNRFHSL